MRPIRLSRRLLASLAGAVAAAVLAATASAQEDATSYPSKPIRIVVGFAAGGGNDLVARIVGPKLSEIVGQPVIVENRPGAAGQLAVTYVQSQPTDGYTIIVGAIGQLAIATAIYPNLPFHPTRTLVPLTLLGSYWLAIAGSMQHGIASLADLVASRPRRAAPRRDAIPGAIRLRRPHPRTRSGRRLLRCLRWFHRHPRRRPCHPRHLGRRCYHCRQIPVRQQRRPLRHHRSRLHRRRRRRRRCRRHRRHPRRRRYR